MEGPRVIAVLEWSPGASVGLPCGTLCCTIGSAGTGIASVSVLGTAAVGRLFSVGLAAKTVIFT